MLGDIFLLFPASRLLFLSLSFYMYCVLFLWLRLSFRFLNNLIMVCAGCLFFFMFLLLGLFTYGFVFFIKFGKILSIISSIIFFCFSPPFFSIWDSCMLSHFKLSCTMLMLCSLWLLKSFFLFVFQIG